jgi:hypothetical protein
MMFNTQYYWVFGLSIVQYLEKKKQTIKQDNILETGSVSILRWGVGDTYAVGSVRKS